MAAEPPLAVDALEDNDKDELLQVRCNGVTKSGNQCLRSSWATVSSLEKSYCSIHAHQDPDAPPLRRCDGITAEGKICARPIPHAPFNKPVFCWLHHDQTNLVKFARCSAKTEDGSSCPSFVRWTPPYFQFCPQHASQVASFGCPITVLPDDVSAIILDVMSPVDRVAFALSNKSCADLVRSWAGQQSIPKHLETQSLTVRTLVFQSLFWSCYRVKYPCGRHHFIHIGNDAPSPTTTADNYSNRSDRVDSPYPLSIPKFCGCNCTELPSDGGDGDDDDDISHVTYGDFLLHRDHSAPFAVIHHPENKNRHPFFGSLLATIRSHPFLFRSTLGLCIHCRDQLSDEDSKNWTKWTQTRSPVRPSPWMKHNRLGKYGADRNSETFLCCRCIGRAILIDWCPDCHGEITPLAIARAYWSTQKSEEKPRPLKKRKV